MKNTNTIEVSNNLVLEYLTTTAAHGGYCWDGVKIEPGTAVTCLKTIATATGLSYYRVKKSIAQLIEAGKIAIVRHKCFAIITICPTLPQSKQTEPIATQTMAEPNSCTQTPAYTSTAASPAASSTTLILLQQPATLLNRAARRRLARQAAKDAARRARHT